MADSRFQPPFVLAKGHTTTDGGVSCMTNTWKTYARERDARKDSHVDWWLYEGAEPWLAFEVTDYEEEQRREEVVL